MNVLLTLSHVYYVGSFISPTEDDGLAIEDFTRSYEENEEFGLNDINTRDYETGEWIGMYIWAYEWVNEWVSVGGWLRE